MAQTPPRRPQVELTDPATRAKVEARLRALEAHLGAVRAAREDTRELLIPSSSERAAYAELTAEAIGRLRRLELTVLARQERLP